MLRPCFNSAEKNFSNEQEIFLRIMHINPQAPVAQKIADELVFRRFQGEGVEFFKIGPHLPPIKFFGAHLLEKTNLSSSSFRFSVRILYHDHVLSQIVL